MAPYVSGNKAPPRYRDVVDHALLRAVGPFNDALHAIAPKAYAGSATGRILRVHPVLTVPNAITLTSIAVASVAAALVAWHGERGWWVRPAAGAVFMFAYFLDLADGNYARRYRCGTTLGDYLDHGGDLIKWLHMAIALVVASKAGGLYAYAAARKPAMALLGILLLAELHGLACVQKYLPAMGTDAGETLGSLAPLCVCEPEAGSTALLGVGTLHAVTALLIATGKL